MTRPAAADAPDRRRAGAATAGRTVHAARPGRRRAPPTSGCSTPAAPTDWVHTDPWRVLRIQSEFVEGFGALAELGPAISVFGSARTTPRRPGVRRRRRGSAAGWSSAGFAVITGGGPGVMEAANKGACEAGGISVGPRHRAALRVRASTSTSTWGSTSATSSRARRCSSSTPRASSCCPAASAPSTSSSRRSPSCRPRRSRRSRSCCVGTAYWSGLVDWLRDTVLADGKISEPDLDMFRVTDDVDEAVAVMVAGAAGTGRAWRPGRASPRRTRSSPTEWTGLRTIGA